MTTPDPSQPTPYREIPGPQQRRDAITTRFEYHPPHAADDPDATIAAHESVRFDCRELALALHDLLPESREKSLALTAVQETMMWANAAIAIHGGPQQIDGDRYVVGDGRSYHGFGRPDADAREATSLEEMGATLPPAEERHPFRPIAPRSETCTCSRRKSDPVHTAETPRHDPDSRRPDAR